MVEEAVPKRFREPTQLRWRDPVLVVCPRCGSRATAMVTGRDRARMLCPECTLFREWCRDRLHVDVGGRPVVLRGSAHGWVDPETGRSQSDYQLPQGQDPRFGLPLWMRIECCGGHLLWANNEAHLAYLEAFIGAELRERQPGLSRYLPAWMTQAHHREEILRSLGRLRASLGDGTKAQT